MSISIYFFAGARMLYKNLPRAVGLRRITLHKSVSNNEVTFSKTFLQYKWPWLFAVLTICGLFLCQKLSICGIFIYFVSKTRLFSQTVLPNYPRFWYAQEFSRT